MTTFTDHLRDLLTDLYIDNAGDNDIAYQEDLETYLELWKPFDFQCSLNDFNARVRKLVTDDESKIIEQLNRKQLENNQL